MSALSYVARRFVAGESMPEALGAVSRLNRDNILTTLDVLGENVAQRSEAERAASEYIALLEEISNSKVRSNVSMKLTQMGLDIGEDFCFTNCRRILEKARSLGNFVRIDMEGSAYTERTLNVFQRLYSEFPNVGIVLQSYLHRSVEDARLLASQKAPVRVCKGAYKEPSSIAFHSMDDIRRSYQEMIEILFQGGSKVGIATHDDKLIDWAIEWTNKQAIDKDRFEFQMLYGLRRKRARELASQGYIVRAYVPYGSHWLPYFVRRLRERKENVFFVIKSMIAD